MSINPLVEDYRIQEEGVSIEITLFSFMLILKSAFMFHAD